MKTIKKTNPTIVNNDQQKDKLRTMRDKPSFRDAYSEFFMYRDLPISKGFLNRLGCEMLEFAYTTQEIFRLDWFFLNKRIFPYLVREWCKEDEEFNSVYQSCKKILGMRREQKGLEKKFDPGMVMASMPMYDDEWMKMLEWKSKLNDNAQDGGTKIVIMEKFSDSDLLEKK